MSAPRPWTLVGNPAGRRVTLFQAALADCGVAPATVLPWADLLTGRRSIGEVPADAVLRVDSPGEEFAVERLLLAAGESAAEGEGTPVVRTAGLTEDRGRILSPRQWYLGLRDTLRDWDRRLADRTDVRWTAPVPGILRAFDKVDCHRHCRDAGVPVPEAIGPVTNFDDLAERMTAADVNRVFVKPAHASSASGVVALHRHRGGWAAVTSAELVRTAGEPRLYNSLKVRRYTDVDDVRDLVDALARHRVHVERWLPKASAGGRACDLRIVTIAGEPRHAVLRTARGPLTNLHAGGRRGDLGAFLRRAPPAAWASVRDTARRTAASFSGTLTLGLDVLLTPGFRRHALLEVNAFGDLLPGVTHDGEDVYTAQVRAARRTGFQPAPVP